MDMNIYTFDIEAYGDDFSGISCVSVYDGTQHKIFQSPPERSMTKEEVCRVVECLSECADKGEVHAWNGTSYDWRVLAVESGMVKLCTRLALTSHDAMLHVLTKKGWPVSLANATKAMGGVQKSDRVTLSSGEEIEFKGDMAPKYWRMGETGAVLEYLRYDTESLHDYVSRVYRRGIMKWHSRNGRLWALKVSEFSQSHVYLNAIWPDQSWMTDPITKRDIVEWMDEEVMNEFQIKTGG